MATGGHLRDSDVPDIYSCAVCMEHLLDRNPRYLTCHHSFCQQCLQRLTNNGQVSCPTCRAVTAVPNNDVTKLIMNFQLVQMMEREKELKEQKQTHFSGQNCHFCGKENAVCKCGDCNQFLCEGCEIKHKKMKMFKNHAILKLCQKHSDKNSHICMKCVQAVCVKCIVLDHADHEDKVEEYQIGVDNLKSNLKEKKKRLTERQIVIKKCQNELYAKKNNVNKQKNELQMRRNSLLKEIEHIDHELLAVSETERKCDEDVNMYKQLEEQYNASCINVNKLLNSPNDEIVACFMRQDISVEKLLNETEKMKIQFKINLNEELKWLEKPVLESNYDILGNFQVKLSTSIKPVEPELFLHSDYDTSRFVVFDNKGTVIRRFKALKEHGSVTCVDVYKNCLYLAQEKQIKCVSNFNTTQERSFTYMPKMNSLSKLKIVNDNILICTDLREGKVYKYNAEDDTTKMVLQGLRFPTYISVDYTPQCTKYILTIGAMLSANGSVNIYNECWQLLTTIKKGINDPQDTVPCPGGFLLADRGSNKITFYSYNGDIVRTVLTEEDGLDGPRSLTLKPPYLWVSSSGGIQSFRVL